LLDRTAVKHLVRKILDSESEIKHQEKYDKNTIGSKFLFTRIAHRNRVARSVKYTLEELQSGKLLDYGCGTGVFVSILNELKAGIAIGYEPYKDERFREDTPVFSEFSDILAYKPFQIITIFEVIEHLSEESLDDFFSRSRELLMENGGVILVSVPIEIGLGLIPKEMNRIRQGMENLYNFPEFVKAAFLGIPAERVDGWHKGFDFRNLLKYAGSKGWETKVVGYGPIPIKTWYINSQVYIKMWMKKERQ